MAGNVYLFNVTGETLNLNVNGGSAGAIQGWASGYQPNRQAVPRALNPGPGQFSNGNNFVSLAWSGMPSSAQVVIDGNRYPINQDLLLFVARNQWQLIDQFGTYVANGSIGGGYNVAAGGEAPEAMEQDDPATPKR